MLVDAAGTAVPAEVERFRFGGDTADRFEVATDWMSPEAGALALKPEIRTGWRTYNFEVEKLHTYVAGGYRVHNTSAPDFVPLDGNGQRLPYIETHVTEMPDGTEISSGVAYLDLRGDQHFLTTIPGAPTATASC